MRAPPEHRAEAPYARIEVAGLPSPRDPLIEGGRDVDDIIADLLSRPIKSETK